MVSSRLKPSVAMTYAATTVLLLERPAKQCTKTRPPSRSARAMNFKHFSKCASRFSDDTSATSMTKYSYTSGNLGGKPPATVSTCVIPHASSASRSCAAPTEPRNTPGTTSAGTESSLIFLAVRRTLTRLTILRTRSSRSSAVIICDASRLTPCATAPRRGCGSSRVPPAAPDGPAAPLSKGSGVKNRGDETSFTVGVIAGHAEKTLNLPESTANRERARACAERASPRASPRDARRPVERSEKRSAASTPEKTRAL
mmetsp:Transcript_6207/g.26380  ORF Transcript_6207/g.26380 Transcript_6207/m.26380 type:complete len:257 (-) Transcript_6207:123-893(-)